MLQRMLALDPLALPLLFCSPVWSNATFACTCLWAGQASPNALRWFVTTPASCQTYTCISTSKGNTKRTLGFLPHQGHAKLTSPFFFVFVIPPLSPICSQILSRYRVLMNVKSKSPECRTGVLLVVVVCRGAILWLCKGIPFVEEQYCRSTKGFPL